MTDTRTVDLPVLGMTCAACVGRVERALGVVDGVTTGEVNLIASRARVAFDPARASIAGVADAIRAAGYEVPADVVDALARDRDGAGESPGAGAQRLAAIEAAEHAEAASLRRDAWLAIALTVPLIAIAMVRGALAARASVPMQLALGTLVVLGPGRRYVRAGWSALRARSPDMNTLIALGAGAAWVSSTVRAVRWLTADGSAPPPELYFEAAAAIVAFVMIGKLLEARARARVSGAVRGLLSLAPARARRVAADGAELEVEAAALVAGDTIAIRPGERLPADGTVIAGASAIDEAMLTGEGVPADKSEGSPVYAGTLNQHGGLTIRVARAGADTAVARIARAVEDAQGGKAPIARLADRVAAWFVPAVLAIAAITFAVWAAFGAGAGVALERAIAVLVIACPCALGLATPAAVAVGTARGAALGVLFRGGAALEIASAIDVICVDKTGTLTTGTPTLVAVISVGAARTQDELLRITASVEHASEHPIARAICAGATARGLAFAAVADAIVEPGAGVSATIDGDVVRVGTRDYLALAGIDVVAAETAATALAAAGRTISYVAIGGALAGVVAVADPPAPGARAAVASLRALGLDVVMVTGDRVGAARWIADEVGITRIHAEVRPIGKAAIVAAERAAGHRVAMIGDGLNDAPAIAAADLGVALASGTDLTAAVADVTLLRGGIASLPIAIGLARATLRAIRRNLVAAFAYNAVCIPVAAGALYPLTGWLLSPMLAAAAMSLSSFSVLLASLGLRRWRAP